MTDMMELAGPQFGPASGGDVHQVVVLLHGVGADGNDLIPLAPHFAQALPDAYFISPNAPYPCDMAPHGHQWFSIQQTDPGLRLAQMRQTGQILNAFIDDQLAAQGVTDRELALVGFSQGTMMSLFVAPRRENACAGIMGYSGRLDSPELLETEIRSRPPVVLVHGDADELLPVQLMDDAASTLRSNGIVVETHLRPGLGHGIDEIGLQLGTQFLSEVLRPA